MTVRSLQAGVLTWILPGAGHFLLGHRGLALVCFIAVTLPYWTGLAFGGILSSVNPYTNRWLYLAELGVGGYTVPCTLISRGLEKDVLAHARLSDVPDQASEPGRYMAYLEAATESRYMSYYPESDVAQIYLATAGLLNLLVVLDAISRAQTGGLPTFQRELRAAPTGQEPGA